MRKTFKLVRVRMYSPVIAVLGGRVHTEYIPNAMKAKTNYNGEVQKNGIRDTEKPRVVRKKSIFVKRILK